MIFGDRTDVVRPELVQALAGQTQSWVSGPEPACLTTARALGAEPEILAALAGPDFGRWRGRSLAEVGPAEPQALSAWLSDPEAAAHGGESLVQLLNRVGTCCDARHWPQGRSVVVVAPLVARALAVHALGAPAEVMFRLDVGPLDRVQLTRSGPSWRLRMG
jgi:broad specificity phosphatase PhoE